MAGLIEWWMSRPFYDDPAKHGWGVVLLQPLVWILSPLFLIVGSVHLVASIDLESIYGQRW
mgnify:CR=1 FL=1